ncbi:MAG: Ldh family oxidoreductase, partial [Gammaproteobacteria bacterium]
PEETFVSPFGGSERLFSNNPLAFTAPTASGPLLFDVSMAITAGGQVARAARKGEWLPEPAIKTADGTITDDPAALDRGGSVMPIGGAGHGHKGHALTIMTEVLTQALGGYGRAQSKGDSEQNSVFLQVLDPAAFGARGDYYREVNRMVSRIQASPADPGGPGVRVPGIASWQRRARQIAEGVVLEPFIMDRLRSCAGTLGVAVPDPIG